DALNQVVAVLKGKLIGSNMLHHFAGQRRKRARVLPNLITDAVVDTLVGEGKGIILLLDGRNLIHEVLGSLPVNFSDATNDIREVAILTLKDTREGFLNGGCNSLLAALLLDTLLLLADTDNLLSDFLSLGLEELRALFSLTKSKSGERARHLLNQVQGSVAFARFDGVGV